MQGDPDTRPDEAPPLRLTPDPGVNVLLLATFPLILWVFRGAFVGLITALIVLWLLTVAIRLIQHGQVCHRLYVASNGTTAPRLPYKILGSGLIGVTVAIIAALQMDSLVAVAAFGCMAAVLGVLAFEPDPMPRKRAPLEAESESDAATRLIERSDLALTQLSDRVAALGDAELIRRTDAARLLILRLLRDDRHGPKDVLRLERPTRRFTNLLEAEVDRLCAERDADRQAFARRRFIAKLEVMSESVEQHVGGTPEDREADRFALEADMLIGRMPRETAA